MPFFIACDFDGTITERDTLSLVVHRYAPDSWADIEARLRNGEISLMQAIEEEFRHVKTTESEVVSYVVGETVIREGFAEFVKWTKERGHVLVVVSSGFRVLIDSVLAKAGLTDLHVHAGDAVFTPTGTVLLFPPASQQCQSICGLCKSEIIEGHKPFPGPFVYIGDGYSDRCAAREADIVFARRGLARYLGAEAISYYPYDDFHDVRKRLEELESGQSARGKAGSPGPLPKTAPHRDGTASE